MRILAAGSDFEILLDAAWPQSFTIWIVMIRVMFVVPALYNAYAGWKP
jgi:hypothetical protein